MNSKKPRTPREELEASLTALLLGELSADKAAALRELMTKDAQLARLYERLEQTIGLVKETAVPAEETTQSAPLKLSSKRREQLLAHFKTIAPKEFTKPRDRTIQVRELAIAAGIVAFIGVAAWFTFNLTQQSFSSTSRISQVDVLESGPAATEIVANDMTKARPRSNVGSITEQTTARLAAETALEMEQTAIIAGSAGGSSGGIGSPSQTIFDAPSAGKPIIDQIVLPTATDYAVSATPRGMYDDQVSTFTLSDPQGVGVAERGDYTPPAYISSNAFIGRYAFSGIPTNQIELAYKTAEPALATKRADSKNSAISQETVNFEDLIREESARTNVGLISDLSDLSRKATEGFGRTGTGATYAQNGWTNGASQQVDEMLRRRAGAVAWTDNAHSKQGGVGLADSSVQQMSRSKLQEGLRNSSENKPAEKVPVIDPATGLPIPVPEFYAKLTRDDLGGIRPLTPTKPTSALALRSSAQAAQTAAASTPVDGEKLAELAQKGKDASGSNVYLGMELAKADVKFGTWGLEADQAGARPRGTNKEEESLKQLGEVGDGVTIAGRVGTPEKKGLALLGPITTTAVSGVAATQRVETLADLSMLTRGSKSVSVENKPELATTTPAETLFAGEPSLRTREIGVATPTNATVAHDATLLFEMGRLDDAEALFKQAAKEDPNNRAANYYLNLIKDRRYRKTLDGKELVTRQAMVDVEKDWLNPSPARGLPPAQNPTVDAYAVQPGARIRGDVVALGGVAATNLSGYVNGNNEWNFTTGTPNRGWLGGAGETNMATAPGLLQSPSNVYSLEVVGYVDRPLRGESFTAGKFIQGASATTNLPPLAGAPPLSKPFADRLQQAGTNTASYDRYTFYRNLEQLGADADKEPKLALSYSNVRETNRAAGGPSSAGDAVISIDPDTRSLVVIADKETAQYIAQVVTNATQFANASPNSNLLANNFFYRQGGPTTNWVRNFTVQNGGEPAAAQGSTDATFSFDLDTRKSIAVADKETSEYRARAVTNGEEMIPPGTIDFRGADLGQVLDLYGKLSGRKVLPATNLASPTFILRAQGPLTRGESIKALEAMLKLNGIGIINEGDKFAKAVPDASAGQMGAAYASDPPHLPAQQVDVAAPKPVTPPPVPQPEIQTRENAFSTFSLNVSDVAFKLAGASLEKGQMPEPASIRSEEFINAFDYRDPEAPAGVPVAFAWERTRYPYAQNRDLLRFSIKTAAQGRQAGRPLNLVLLLDNSGSMERGDRVAIIREALKVLASQLQPQDKLSVITFARTAQLRVDGVAGNQAAQVAEDIGGLTPEGGTNIEEAMNLAYQTALRHYLANGINRVVLLTDGAANLGNVEPESLKQKVEANRKQGVALDCFGIGWEGFNDDLLETLSRNGDGRYGFINSPEEAATEFAGQLAGALNVAASDVKVQVEFNPARVTAYRQIGYAKHQLTKEQFRDNTVDAAEIAAQEAGNALYVIEVNPAGQGPLGTVRVRFKVPGTLDYREHEWSVPFNGNAVALQQASPAMRLAATTSAFSEWLASSPYATEVTPDTLLSYLGGVPEVYGADARPKKLEWMIRQAKSLAGGEVRNSNVETRSKPEESKQKDANRVQFP